MKADATGPTVKFERASIETLISRDYPGLRLLIIRRARDEALAADVLHDAVCTTLEKWDAGEIARPELICGYVFQVAMNMLRNHRRSVAERSDRRADFDSLDDLPGHSDGVTDALLDGWSARVRSWLEGLGTVRDRLILKRFYLDEEDKSAICRDMQLEPSQFDKVLHRARARLRDLVEKSGLGGSDFYSLLVAL